MTARLYDEDKVIKRIVNKKYSSCSVPKEDLYQIGWIGYLKAIRNYNPKYGKMSLTYASQYIRNEINRAINRKSEESCEEYIDDIDYGQHLLSLDNKIKNEEVIKRVRNKLHLLEDRERDIIMFPPTC